MALNATAEANVAALIVQWNLIRLDVVKMEAGAAGAINGVTYVAEDRRKQILGLFQTYVPVLHMVDAVRKKQGLRSQDRPCQVPIL